MAGSIADFMPMIDSNIFDLFIIGGGINGVGIAADAAGRGMSVVLCEQDDLASGTSSRSSKLIHGGLRYLEQFEFRLVREALREREVLLRKAPHIIHPLHFIMPLNKDLRPAWMIRLGLYIYDHLAGKISLPKSLALNLKQHKAGQILKSHFKRGFIYSDCWVDDARLVVLNAIAAKEKGASIFTRTQFMNAKRQAGLWEIELKDLVTQKMQIIYARALVNAAGPWVDKVLDDCLHTIAKSHIVLVKGSHIIVPKIHADNYAYILQHSDKRVVFVLPYLENYSLIGTTDVNYQGDPAAVAISQKEIEYLCAVTNYYFKSAIQPAHVVWSYAGVRPLKAEATNNPSTITRDYSFEVNSENNTAPLLTIFGGKITTYRKLAEHALQELKPYFPNCGPAWTASSPLPGGDIPNTDFDLFFAQLVNKYVELPKKLLYRYARNYGSLTKRILHDVTTITDLGEDLGFGLFEREVEYLVVHEWAKTAADILWRRTKLGVGLSKEELKVLTNRLEAYLSKKAKY